MSTDLSIFRCLSCGGQALEGTAETLKCPACGATHPVIDGVPVMVRDWAAHERDIREARAVKPGWYETEQPPEEASPWRHHLRKRRLYVSGFIQQYLRSLAVVRVPRLLDLGCGDGGHLGWLSAFADRVYGSDYNLLRLVRTRHRAPASSPIFSTTPARTTLSTSSSSTTSSSTSGTT
jgi:uncharacterized protein YbaR (Trm112 family)